jgi:hypothetical protein
VYGEERRLSRQKRGRVEAGVLVNCDRSSLTLPVAVAGVSPNEKRIGSLRSLISLIAVIEVPLSIDAKFCCKYL